MAAKRQYTRHEAVIRDYLAAHLDLIETGLVLIDKEVELENTDGARGFVDVLARDSFGHCVIIEIKRSDSSARQALHELHKYVELIQTNHGLSDADVRCILVSTDWHELTPAFSSFKRRVDFSVDGYRLFIEAGTPQRFQKIVPTFAPLPLRPFREHVIYLFLEAEKQACFYSRLNNAMAATGISSAIVMGMDSKPSFEIMYPFAVYLMVFDVTDEASKACISEARDESLPNATVDDLDHLFEEVVLSKVNDLLLEDIDSLEVSYPEKYLTMLPRWDITEMRRTGRLLNNLVNSDEDIQQHLLGHKGTGQIAFNGSASPSHSAGWQQAKDRVRRCLMGNSSWITVAEYVFADAERRPGRVTVSFEIYNPCDITMTMFQLGDKGDPRFVPEMNIRWKSDSDDSQYLVVGLVAWDGMVLNKSPTQIVNSAFGGDDGDYFLARTIGAVVHFDAAIMEGNGLTYKAARWVATGCETIGSWLDALDGTLVERGISETNVRPFPDFIRENAKYVSNLVAWFRSNSLWI